MCSSLMTMSCQCLRPVPSDMFSLRPIRLSPHFLCGTSNHDSASRLVTLRLHLACFSSQSDQQQPAPMPKFEVVEQSVAYKRYLTLFDRQVKVTSEKTGKSTTLAYDVIGHEKCNFRFAVVMPFHTATESSGPEVTLICEYCQGPDAVCYNLPTGGFDAVKHKAIEDCARAELSEEALLQGGELVRLIPEDHPGFAEVKWCANRFVPFLAINPRPDLKPGARDAEEFITVRRMGIEEFRKLNDGGDLMLPSVVTANLALRYLESKGLV